jgi:ABC-2 type transport system ATP-binding protein
MLPRHISHKGVTAARVVRDSDGVVALRVTAGPTLRPAVARAVVNAGLDLMRIDRGSTKLENIFLELTRAEPRNEAVS